jgi:hypothetical protein
MKMSYNVICQETSASPPALAQASPLFIIIFIIIKIRKGALSPAFGWGRGQRAPCPPFYSYIYNNKNKKRGKRLIFLN